MLSFFWNSAHVLPLSNTKKPIILYLHLNFLSFFVPSPSHPHCHLCFLCFEALVHKQTHTHTHASFKSKQWQSVKRTKRMEKIKTKKAPKRRRKKKNSRSENNKHVQKSTEWAEWKGVGRNNYHPFIHTNCSNKYIWIGYLNDLTI